MQKRSICADDWTDTPRYEPILPFVRLVLFTGMRVSEALQIRGSDVEDGELHVRAEVRQDDGGADGGHDDLHDVDVDEAA